MSNIPESILGKRSSTEDLETQAMEKSMIQNPREGDFFEFYYASNLPPPPISILPVPVPSIPVIAHENTPTSNSNNATPTSRTNKSKRQRSTKDEDVSEFQGSVTKVSRALPKVTIERMKKPIPKRTSEGVLIFPDFPEFAPNLTPKEILQNGSFGGTYFRVIQSGITGQTYYNAWQEFPVDWFEGLNIARDVASSAYNSEVNTYKVACGGDLKMWEESGWITDVDPFGWFQWYCRFYLGRRCSDDHRQITRALGVMGPSGRWRKNLINKCLASNKSLDEAVDDVNISPKVRQLLQHWAYKLTLADLVKAEKGKNSKAKTTPTNSSQSSASINPSTNVKTEITKES